MDFFRRIRPDSTVAEGYVFLLDAIDLHLAAAAAASDPVIRRHEVRSAEKVRAILLAMWRDYRWLESTQPGRADEFIRARLRATAVRPPTSGRLERAVASFAIPSQWPLAGVGVASVLALDRGAVNPRGGGIYWRSQEHGLPVIPGQRPTPGYFMPGYGAPNPAEFRNHPYFEQMPYVKGMPLLVRKRDLQPRHFLRDGTRNFVAWRRVEMQRIQRKAITALSAI